MKNLQDTIQDLTNKIAASENTRAKIIEDLNMKDNQVKELQSSHTKLMDVSFHILYQAINKLITMPLLGKRFAIFTGA